MGIKKVQYGKLNIKVLRFKDGRSSLELVQRGIQDITEVIGLNQLQDLEELNLSKNKISEITDLENLKNLKKLDLSENQIINIKGLENLTNLIQLDLSKNQLKNININFDSVKKTYYIIIHINIITNIWKLKLILISGTTLYIKTINFK